MTDMSAAKTVSNAQWNALLTRTRAKGASLGVATEADVELLSDEYRRIRDRVKLAAPEPEVLRIAGEEAKRNGTSRLTSRQIDRIIRATRAAKKNNRPNGARISEHFLRTRPAAPTAPYTPIASFPAPSPAGRSPQSGSPAP